MSGRHSGGVRGTVQFRGYCPVCGRGVAGGNVSRDRRTISLRPHKRLAGEPATRREWCPGGGSNVASDAELRARWALALRARR